MEKDNNAELLFGGDQGDNGRWEADRRFVSPEFNPIYRQGLVGPHNLRESEFVAFLELGRSNPTAAAAQLLAFVDRTRLKGGDFGDVVMGRLSARASDFDPETARAVISVFAEAMDEYHRRRPKFEMFLDLWEQSGHILRAFRSSVTGFDLDDRIIGMAEHGKALAWMVAVLASSELYAQGIIGEERSDRPQSAMRPEHLQALMATLGQRIGRLKTDDVLRLERLDNVLHVLKAAPWTEPVATEIVSRLAGPRVDDDTFLAFMAAIAGIVVSSDRGAYRTISMDRVGRLVGSEYLSRRWGALREKKLPPDLAKRRSQLDALIRTSQD